MIRLALALVLLAACGGSTIGSDEPAVVWQSSRVYGELEVSAPDGKTPGVQFHGVAGVEADLKLFGTSVRVGVQTTGDTLGLCAGLQAWTVPLCVKIPIGGSDS